MNIVFLFSDEHTGSVMGNSGHPVVRTPYLDRLAEQSYAFDNAYCNSPICTPSRLSLLTGRFPHQIGAWDLGAIADRQYQTWGDYTISKRLYCISSIYEIRESSKFSHSGIRVVEKYLCDFRLHIFKRFIRL